MNREMDDLGPGYRGPMAREDEHDRQETETYRDDEPGDSAIPDSAPDYEGREFEAERFRMGE